MRGNLKCAAILPGNVLSNAYAGCVVLCRMGLYSTGQRRMPVKHFLDTNVLIYAVAKNDPRASKAEALLAGGSIISIQSLNEFVSVARKLGMPWKQINEFVDLICVLCPNPVPISLDTHKGAVAIAQKYGYSVYDALIVSAALESSCETLYSEGLQDGQTINQQLTIRNPFQ